MRMKAPRVPPAATAAWRRHCDRSACLPGTYTLKMTRGTETFTPRIDVKDWIRARLIRSPTASFELDAAMRVYALLGDLSFDVDRINGVHDALLDRAGKLGAPMIRSRNSVNDWADEAGRDSQEDRRYQGRRRDHRRGANSRTAANVYGVLAGDEGRPADYYVARIDSLTHERADEAASFDAFVAKDLKAANASLAAKKLEAVQPATREAWDKAASDSEEGGSGNGGAAWLREYLRTR